MFEYRVELNSMTVKPSRALQIHGQTFSDSNIRSELQLSIMFCDDRMKNLRSMDVDFSMPSSSWQL